MVQTLAFPLQIDGTGRCATQIDGGAIMRDRMCVLLATLPGERPSDLSYGVNYADASFGSQDHVDEALVTIINQALFAYLPSVTISRVTVTTPTDDTVVMTVTAFTSDNEVLTVDSSVDLTTLGNA